MSDEKTTSSNEPTVVKLDHPFTWADEQVTEISVPRPKAFHMRGINIKRLESETDEMFKLVQKLLGQPPKYLDQFDFVDVQKIMEVVSGFLDNGPTTGNTSSPS